MYADDSTLHTSGNTIVELENALSTDLEHLSTWCKSNRMLVNTAKTKTMLITSHQKKSHLPKINLDLDLNGEPLTNIDNGKLLGVVLNCNLSWNSHVTFLCGNLSRQLALLRRIRHLLPLRARRAFYISYIQSSLDYCSVVWANCDQLSFNKVFRLQKQAIRLVCGAKWDEPSGPIFKRLGCLPLDKRFEYHIGVQMYKIVNGLCPKYLQDLFHPANVHSSRTLRSTSSNNLYLPRIKTEIFRKSLSYSGTLLWNGLPSTIKTCPSLRSFKTQYFKRLLDYA